jgi:hypothetical protein
MYDAAKEDPMHHLTAELAAASEAQKPTPLELVNPSTQEVFVLIRKDVYDPTCTIIGGGRVHVWDNEADGDLIRKRT